MKLSTSLLLPVLVSAASAVSDARVYLLRGGEWQNPSDPPTVSPQEARLVFAERLGVSQYHELGDSSASTLSYINKFGGRQDFLFQDRTGEMAPELVMIVEGVSSETAEELQQKWSSIKPAFIISSPPPYEENQKLVLDMQQQMGAVTRDCTLGDAINPFNERCWNGKAKVMQIDLRKSSKNPPTTDELVLNLERLVGFAAKGEMNVIVAFMPETSQSAKSSSRPYGRYQMPSQVQLDRRQQLEEVLTEFPASSSLSPNSRSNQLNASYGRPIRGVVPLCHPSLDSCISTTNNCSSHGVCHKRYSSVKDTGDAKPACYTCSCQSTVQYFGIDKSPKTTYWGGAACQKIDVSGPFWLFAIFSVVMVGLVSWSVGLLFSIGEEKLPGVIGAGVSSKAR